MIESAAHINHPFDQRRDFRCFFQRRRHISPCADSNDRHFMGTGLDSTNQIIHRMFFLRHHGRLFLKAFPVRIQPALRLWITYRPHICFFAPAKHFALFFHVFIPVLANRAIHTLEYRNIRPFDAL